MMPIQQTSTVRLEPFHRYLLVALSISPWWIQKPDRSPTFPLNNAAVTFHPSSKIRQTCYIHIQDKILLYNLKRILNLSQHFNCRLYLLSAPHLTVYLIFDAKKVLESATVKLWARLFVDVIFTRHVRLCHSGEGTNQVDRHVHVNVSVVVWV